MASSRRGRDIELRRNLPKRCRTATHTSSVTGKIPTPPLFAIALDDFRPLAAVYPTQLLVGNDREAEESFVFPRECPLMR
jgi:hypothetical protein